MLSYEQFHVKSEIGIYTCFRLHFCWCRFVCNCTHIFSFPTSKGDADKYKKALPTHSILFCDCA